MLLGAFRPQTTRKIKKVTDSEHVEPKQRIDMIVDDPTDNRILECAATSGSDYLVSGDNHLLKVGQHQGCKMVTPAEFLEIQSQQGRER